MLLYTSSSLPGKMGKGEGGDKSEQPHKPVDRRYSDSGVNHHPLAAALSRAGQEKVGQPQKRTRAGTLRSPGFSFACSEGS